jgi:hypothetical protein
MEGGWKGLDMCAIPKALRLGIHWLGIYSPWGNWAVRLGCA